MKDRNRWAVAVVCDSPVLSLQLCRQLTRLDCYCTAIKAETDPARLQDFDLVFIELMLLHQNGFALMRLLRTRLALPLVLVTGTGRHTDHDWGKAAGATAVLERPLADDAVAQVLSCCCQ
jgi:CheY-like chemotaxis protein